MVLNINFYCYYNFQTINILFFPTRNYFFNLLVIKNKVKKFKNKPNPKILSIIIIVLCPPYAFLSVYSINPLLSYFSGRILSFRRLGSWDLYKGSSNWQQNTLLLYVFCNNLYWLSTGIFCPTVYFSMCKVPKILFKYLIKNEFPDLKIRIVIYPYEIVQAIWSSFWYFHLQWNFEFEFIWLEWVFFRQ